MAKTKEVGITQDGLIHGAEQENQENFKRQCEDIITHNRVQLSETQKRVLMYKYGLFNHPTLSYRDIQALYAREGRVISMPRLSQLKTVAVRRMVNSMKTWHREKNQAIPTVVVDVDKTGKVVAARANQEGIKVSFEGQKASALSEPKKVSELLLESLTVKLITVPIPTSEWPFETSDVASVTYTRKGVCLETKIIFNDLSEEVQSFNVLQDNLPHQNYSGHVINSRYDAKTREAKIWVVLPVRGDVKYKPADLAPRVQELGLEEALYVPMPDTYNNLFVGRKWQYQKRKQEGAPQRPSKPMSYKAATTFTDVEKAVMQAIAEDPLGEFGTGKNISQVFAAKAAKRGHKDLTHEHFMGGLGSLIKKNVVKYNKTKETGVGLGIFYLSMLGRLLLDNYKERKMA